eukprot:m.165902 g.165902  ORF g.165902 m.165902 type:complete len:2389 (+) comp14438_c0_seq1:111-7277(+)
MATPMEEGAHSGASSRLDTSAFAVRVIDADFYYTAPQLRLDEGYNAFRGEAPSQVPVIRIFGTTPSGQPCCCHVHNVYPYFYVPWDHDQEPTLSVRMAFAKAVDAAVCRAQRRERPYLVVAYVEPVDKFDYYGFYDVPRTFLKISFYNPYATRLAADLLQEGAIGSTVYQPYEAHIPYVLQFLSDKQLQGMNLVHSTGVTFRHPLPPAPASPPSSPFPQSHLSQGFAASQGFASSLPPSTPPYTFLSYWSTVTVPTYAINGLGRQSTCQLEVDVVYDDVLPGVSDSPKQPPLGANDTNPLTSPDSSRHGSEERHTPHNPGLVALWEDEKARRRELGQSTQFTQPKPTKRTARKDTDKTVNEQYQEKRFQIAVELDRQLAARATATLSPSQPQPQPQPQLQGVGVDPDGASSDERAAQGQQGVERASAPSSPDDSGGGSDAGSEVESEIDPSQYQGPSTQSQSQSQPFSQVVQDEVVERVSQAHGLSQGYTSSGDADGGDNSSGETNRALVEREITSQRESPFPSQSQPASQPTSQPASQLSQRGLEAVNTLLDLFDGSWEATEMTDEDQALQLQQVERPQTCAGGDTRDVGSVNGEHDDVYMRYLHPVLEEDHAESQEMSQLWEGDQELWDVVEKVEKEEQAAEASRPTALVLDKKGQYESEVRNEERTHEEPAHCDDAGGHQDMKRLEEQQTVLQFEGRTSCYRTPTRKQDARDVDGHGHSWQSPDAGAIGTSPSTPASILKKAKQSGRVSSVVGDGPPMAKRVRRVRFELDDVQGAEKVDGRGDGKIDERGDGKAVDISQKGGGHELRAEEVAATASSETGTAQSVKPTLSVLRIATPRRTQGTGARQSVPRSDVVFSGIDVDGMEMVLPRYSKPPPDPELDIPARFNELYRGSLLSPPPSPSPPTSSSSVLQQQLHRANSPVTSTPQPVTTGTLAKKAHTSEDNAAVLTAAVDFQADSVASVQSSKATSEVSSAPHDPQVVQLEVEVETTHNAIRTVTSSPVASARTAHSHANDKAAAAQPILIQASTTAAATSPQPSPSSDRADCSKATTPAVSEPEHEAERSPIPSFPPIPAETAQTAFKPPSASVPASGSVHLIQPSQLSSQSDATQHSSAVSDSSDVSSSQIFPGQLPLPLNRAPMSHKDKDGDNVTAGVDSETVVFAQSEPSPQQLQRKQCATQGRSGPLLPQQRLFSYTVSPPTCQELTDSMMHVHNMHLKVYREPFYETLSDAPSTVSRTVHGEVVDWRTRHKDTVTRFVSRLSFAQGAISRFCRYEARQKLGSSPEVIDLSPAPASTSTAGESATHSTGAKYLATVLKAANQVPLVTLTPARPPPPAHKLMLRVLPRSLSHRGRETDIAVNSTSTSPSKLLDTSIETSIASHYIGRSPASNPSGTRAQSIEMGSSVGKTAATSPLSRSHRGQTSLLSQVAFMSPTEPRSRVVYQASQATQPSQLQSLSGSSYNGSTDQQALQTFHQQRLSHTQHTAHFQQASHATQAHDRQDSTSQEHLGEGEGTAIDARQQAKTKSKQATSQIGQATPANTYGFKLATQAVSEATVLQSMQHLTLLSLELFADSRGMKLSDPEQDPILFLIYHIQTDAECDLSSLNRNIICVEQTPRPFKRLGIKGSAIEVQTEEQLFLAFFNVINQVDPDILIGFEIQMSSWGYLIQRGMVLGFDILKVLSRLVTESPKAPPSAIPNNPYGARHTSELSIRGRIVLNVWRLLRHELALTSYSFENTVYHVLHKRVPFYDQQQLRTWFYSCNGAQRWRVYRYTSYRSLATLQLLHTLNIIERTSEFARLFGILFYEVLSRGSQFRVESIMLRIAHQRNYIAISPSKPQVRAQNAAEALPLILEPESRFYTSPVLVLDFQSLYPSMMIAYNMCYSTCLGKIPTRDAQEMEMPTKFGVSEYKLKRGLLSSLHANNSVHVCPNGTMFCTREVRGGVLPDMLQEILDTRVIVKKAMQGVEEGTALHRLQNARQLGLKLIANVTYGYTSASFSGRMPCIDIADAIVQQARETLSRAMRLVETTKRWNAKVVYGDTDSMFVVLPGATKDQAFKIGREIADAVTATNPPPVKLKFEKVYLPCILQTKKRYVGYMYETPDQAKPVFDAKGIETVRRDVCPAVAKVMEKTLRVLFETQNLTAIKSYLQQQWQKILYSRVNLRDFIFSKEYRGRDSYSPKACVAALEIANKLTRLDPRAEPRVRERVPYVIVCGPPRSTLISLVRQPHELLDDPSLRLNAIYYIKKQLIPPLERCFVLMGVNISSWYEEMPKVHRLFNAFSTSVKLAHRTMDQFYNNTRCAVCSQPSLRTLCDECRSHPQRTWVILNSRFSQIDAESSMFQRICGQCMGVFEGASLSCTTVWCPVRFQRARVQHKLNTAQHALTSK